METPGAAVRSLGMATANIRDRRSIEEVYPPAAFAVDAAVNQLPGSQALKGVLIETAPDAAGRFEIVAASRQVGETGAAIFLPASRPLAADAGDGMPPSRAAYDAFVDEIITAASRRGFRAEEAPGPGDPRLRGPRQ